MRRQKKPGEREDKTRHGMLRSSLLSILSCPANEAGTTGRTFEKKKSQAVYEF